MGACCNVDETCSDPIARDVCEAAGGLFQGVCDRLHRHRSRLRARALRRPPAHSPGAPADRDEHGSGDPVYELTVVEASQQLHSELPPDRRCGPTGGRSPGPTIEADVGTPIDVTWSNGLPMSSVTRTPGR